MESKNIFILLLGIAFAFGIATLILKKKPKGEEEVLFKKFISSF